MKTNRNILGLVCMIIIIGLLSSCAAFMEYGKLEKSARKDYMAGNYDSAIFTVVNSLKLEPTYDEAQELIKEVFPKAVDAHLSNIISPSLQSKSAYDNLSPAQQKILDARRERIESKRNKKDEGEAYHSKNFETDVIVSEYEALIRINKAVKSLPTLISKKTKEVIKFDIVDYSTELIVAKESAAQAHYEEGVSLSKRGTSMREQAAKEFTTANTYVSGYKDALDLAAEGFYQEGRNLIKVDKVDTQKQAAKEFTRAMSYVPGYKDSTDLYDKARRAGIQRIAIIPFNDKTGKNGQYGAISDTVVDQIVNNVINDNSATEFLEIISRDQLEEVMKEQKLGLTGIMDGKTTIDMGKVRGVHAIVTGKITFIGSTPAREITRNIAQAKRIVVGERMTTCKDRKGNTVDCKEDVYGDVHATVTVHTREAGASINGSYEVTEVKTAAIKDHRSFEGKYKFKSEWYTFSGDSRALDAKYQRSEEEKYPPSEEEMVNQAASNLSYDLSNRLKDYAR